MYWLRAKIHPTWHFTAACMGILVGITAAQWWNSFAEIIWLFVGLICYVLAGAAGRRWLLAVAVLGGGLIGLWRGAVDQQALTAYASLYGKHVALTGKVADDSDTNSRGQATLRLQNVSLDGHQLPGNLWVSAPLQQSTNLQRSDTVRLDGKLQPGFGSYPAGMIDTNFQLVTREQPGDVALAMRNGFSQAVTAAIHEPAASLGIGYLLGQKRGLPGDLATALQVAGLTHIVVASGYNLTILVRLGRRLFEKISKYLSALTGIGLIVGFVAITGLSPSMTRAGLVAGLGLWAWYYGRKFHPVTLLGFAAAVTVLFNPSYAWGNIGWQLSFAAFAGVMIVAPLLTAYFFGVDRPPGIVQIMFETFSAQLATLPIILFIFGKFSAIAIVSNLIILPFVPLAMLLTFGAGLAALVAPTWATIAGWPAQQLLDAMIAIIKWCADIPWAQVDWRLSVGGVVVWYVLIGFSCWYMWRASGYKLCNASIIE
jgi:competence protein ComEC